MMQCLRCNYPIGGVIEPRCPECGLAFDRYDRSSYRLAGDHRTLELVVKKGVLWTLAIAPWLHATIPYLSWKYVFVTTGQLPDASNHPGLLGILLFIPWGLSTLCGCLLWSGPVAILAAQGLRNVEPWIRLRDRRTMWSILIGGHVLLAFMYLVVYRNNPRIVSWWLD